MNIVTPYNFDLEMLRSGAFILIDKPFDWTSFDVVNKLRIGLKIALGQKKFKLGHAGTLDPYATGLLVLGAGSYTKKIEQIQNDEKFYHGTLELGATTASYDAELEVDQRFAYDHITSSQLERAVETFKGHIDQVPPQYSAVKINGQAAYKMARRGVDIKMKSRKVDIYDFDIIEFSSPIVKFDVRCGKGTYIRSLVHDLGKQLDSGAYLTQLRRTGIGLLNISDAWKIEDFVARIDIEKQKLKQ